MKPSSTVYLRYPDQSDPVVVSIEQARVALLSHQASLHGIQEDPPFWLLKDIRRTFEDLSGLGPRADDPQAIMKVSKELIIDGVVQDYANGVPIPWMRDTVLFVGKFLDKIIGPSPSGKNLFFQSTRPLSYILNTHLEVDERKPVSEMVSVNWAVEDDHGERGAKLRSFIPMKWRDYLDEVEKTKKFIGLAMLRASETAQILIFDARTGRSKLLSYLEVSDLMQDFERSWLGYQSVFTSDLPAEWFANLGILHKSRADATAWMDRVFHSIDDSDRIPAVSDVKLVAQKRYNLSANATSDAWKKSKYYPRPKGEIPAGKRLSIREINGIE